MNRVVVLLALVLPAVVACGQPPSPATSAGSTAVLVSELPGALEQLAPLRRGDNDARRDAIVQLFRERGFDTTLHAFPNDGRPGGDPRETGHNIVVDISEGDRDVIIGAHFDRVGVGEGMVDNAASVIVLLHVAETIRRVGSNHRVRFVLFDLEEVGLVGSRHFAAAVDPERVAAMINLDVTGYGDTVFYGHTVHGHGTLYAAMQRGCATALVRCVDFPVYPPSDHLSFQRAGIPNISLSVLPAAEVHQLWLMLNAREHSGLAEGFLPGVFLTIHTQGDTLARVEPSAMTLAHNALISLLHELDGGIIAR